MNYTKETICPDCCISYDTDKNLRCCLDHLTDPKEIEEYAWELWGELKAYKAGTKTLKAEIARLTPSLQAEKALVKELIAGLDKLDKGLETLRGM